MSQKAKLFLEENTPTLLEKINAFNNTKPKKKNYKSFSEHQITNSNSAINLTSPSNPLKMSHFTSSQKLNFQFNDSSHRFDSENPNEMTPINESRQKQQALRNNIKNLKKNRDFLKGLGLSLFHSSSTFQNSIPSISFSKAARFAEKEDSKLSLNSLGSPKKIFETLLPALNSSQKGVSFGFGQKILQPTHLRKKDLEMPGPNKYNVREKLIKPGNAKSFGMPFKVYSKVYLEHMTQPEPDMPGPGFYNIASEINKKKGKKLIKDVWARESSKNDAKTGLMNSNLPPDYYDPKMNFVWDGRYRSVSFGQAERKL